jgi:hypothetical protein
MLFVINKIAYGFVDWKKEKKNPAAPLSKK